jgi:hypothetical protein
MHADGAAAAHSVGRGRSFIICSQRGGKFSRFLFPQSVSPPYVYIVSFSFIYKSSHSPVVTPCTTNPFLYTPPLSRSLSPADSRIFFASLLSFLRICSIFTTFLTLIRKTVLVTLSQHNVRSRIVHLNHFALSNRLLDSRFISHTRDFSIFF